MLYALLGDIHANLQAFEAALRKTYEEGADVRLGVGDLVGYGADPNECICLARKEGVNSVLGNHDAAVLPDGSQKKRATKMNPSAKSGLEYTERVLTEENRSYLDGLPVLNDGGRMVVVHSTLADPANFPDYVEGADAVSRCFAEMRKNVRVCFLAHSHLPRGWSMENGVVKPLWDFGNSVNQPSFPIEFPLEKGKRYIVNVGSVGQPRDSNPDACLALYDDSKETVRLVRVSYDIDGAMKRIREEGIMEFNAMRLRAGS